MTDERVEWLTARLDELEALAYRVKRAYAMHEMFAGRPGELLWPPPAVRRYEDGVRRVASVAEITGLEGLTPLTQEIFRFERHGRKGRCIVGDFVATGVVP